MFIYGKQKTEYKKVQMKLAIQLNKLGEKLFLHNELFHHGAINLVGFV